MFETVVLTYVMAGMVTLFIHGIYFRFIYVQV